MKKIILLLVMAFIIGGCGSPRHSALETKEDYEFKVVNVKGKVLNLALLVDYMEDGETVDKFAERIYKNNYNIMYHSNIIDTYDFRDGKDEHTILIPVKKKK